MNDQTGTSSTNEPFEVKLIAAASDGMVNVTPEKCERIRTLLDAQVSAAVAAFAAFAEKAAALFETNNCDVPTCDIPSHMQAREWASQIRALALDRSHLDAMLAEAERKIYQQCADELSSMHILDDYLLALRNRWSQLAAVKGGRT